MNSIFSPKDDEALKKQELIQEHIMKEDEIRKQVKTSMKKPTGLFSIAFITPPPPDFKPLFRV